MTTSTASVTEPLAILSNSDTAAADLIYLSLGWPTLPTCAQGAHCSGEGAPCRAPGKVPHLKDWSRRYVDPPLSRLEFLRLRRVDPLRYGGGLGSPLRQGELVLDIDLRSCGFESLKRLQALYGPLPETPTTQTGGGGRHFRLSVPKEVALPAGGSLAALGFPGVEWKTRSGFVVLPPSPHASGKRYLWEPGFSPLEVPVAEAPSWLIQLLLEAAGTSSRSWPRRSFGESAGAGHPEGGDGRQLWRKLEWAEVVGAFQTAYPQGSRRVSTGLPRLCGILHSRGVSRSQALAFLQEWQSAHFRPPLDEGVLESQVAGMYQRWGEVPEDPEQHSLLLRLLRALSGPGSGTAQESFKTPQGDAPTARLAPARRRALVEARMTALYGLRRSYAAWLDQRGPADLHTPCVQGYLSPHAPPDLPILLEDPRGAPSKEDLCGLRSQVEPPDSPDDEPKGTRLLQTCGWELSGRCPDHGERLRTRRSCRLPDHAACPTQTTERLRVLKLPDPPPGGAYREAWFALPFALPGTDGLAWAEAVRQIAQTWAAFTGRLARRRIGQGILARSLSFFLARPQAIAHLKLLFLEAKPGEADAAIQEACEALGATVLGDKRLPTGNLAVLQLMEDTMAHLAGLAEEAADLYAAWFFGVKGSRLFQSYGSLYGQMKEEWMQGEGTLDRGESQVNIEHNLGTQVIVKARAEEGRTWVASGVVHTLSWRVEQVMERSFVIHLSGPAPQPLRFQWRVKQNPKPRCDLCGKPLDMILMPPGRADGSTQTA